ncbi:WD40-repeat-containing domain protein [Mycotypha africana]|uniref:WD40-repeat-containing domain protein n=1 Tax=Mycotypha africana TaxID=64632 RepID=UPI0023015F45|nr:WD40-repeat-containing domain protein [Mycotypha africana]KAI8977098.1 WD40-repeat-containing domain protein [Mycotypha africana]
MNLELLDPWVAEFPQLIEDTLEDGFVLNCRFNKHGTLLAAGCLDGRCVVWDFDSKGVARNLVGHVKSVTSISWSRNGRYLLSASRDWSCIYWDLASGTKKLKIRFDAPVLMAHMHPKNNNRFVAALFQQNPVIVDIDENGEAVITPLPLEPPENDGSIKPPVSYVTAISWNKAGNRVYTGTAKGYLSIINVDKLKMVYSLKVTSSTIKNIHWAGNGRDILINATDRIIRYFRVNDDEIGAPVLCNKYQDLVNRIQWSQCCFSANSELVIGGSGHRAEHNIYIWDKDMGNLVKILEGPKEPLDDLAWHPHRPIIASVSSFGNIYIWKAKHTENWSAFAPDFVELEENLEYEEKEDEFDVVPEEEKTKRKQVDEDILVDVTTCERIQAFVDSDAEEEDADKELYYLTTEPLNNKNKDGRAEYSSDEEFAKRSLKKAFSRKRKKRRGSNANDSSSFDKTKKEIKKQ